MLRKTSDNKAQAILSEHVLVFFIVAAVIGAMTVYFKRAVQARIRDSRLYMIRTVYNTGLVDLNKLDGYEPYYTKTDSNVTLRDIDKDALLGGGSTGIARHWYNSNKVIETRSITAPPKDYR